MIKLKKIKWENLTTIGIIIFAIERLLANIELNGVSQDIRIEIAFYSLSVIGVRYLIKDLRLNPTNWLIEK